MLELSLDEGIYASSLCLAKNLQVIFVGTNIGSIRVFLWPITLNKDYPDIPPEFTEFHIHSGKIVGIEVTYDAQTLITCAEDGTIFFCQLKEFYNGVEFKLNSATIQHANPIKKKQYYQSQKCKVHLQMNDLSLVFNSNQEKTQQIQELKYKEENLKAYYQEERNSTANKFAEEINELNIKNAQNLENEKLKFKRLQEEHENERVLLLKVFFIVNKSLEFLLWFASLLFTQSTS